MDDIHAHKVPRDDLHIYIISIVPGLFWKYAIFVIDIKQISSIKALYDLWPENFSENTG